MSSLKFIRPLPWLASLLLLAALGAGQLAQAQTPSPLLQLKAANYNPTTGLWTATVGANAQATGTYPTLATGASPNGSSAVVFAGSNPMTLATSIPAANGYTAFAYVMPATTSGGPYALFGGASGSFEYRINAGKQNALKEQVAQLGVSTTTVPSTSFSLIDVTITNTGAVAFRFNGSADGTANSPFSLSAPISTIGYYGTGSGTEYFNGSVCEIDIYPGVLTPTQITNVEAALTAAYVTPLPTGPILLADISASPSVATVGGNDTLSATFTGATPISYQWQISPNSNGAGASNIAGATNTTLNLTNLQLANSGYYYRVQATNAISPYITNSSWLQLTVQPLTPLVQLIATNYDGSSVWTDTSGNGNNATYSGTTAPTLATFVTPNGGSAVNITSGSGSFVLSSSLAQSNGYTVFAYAQPTNVIGRHALTGGSASGALEYDIYNTNQDYLIEYLSDVGNGTSKVSTTSFSLFNLAVNSSAANFRINEAYDGSSVAGATFTQPITRIGNNHGSGDGFVGQIAEIDIYSGVLSYLQITNIEAQLTAKYITANSIVIGAATVAPTNTTFAGNTVTLSAPVIGGTGTTTYHWQTDNGSGGASFANISGATSTNYLLNTTGLLGSYQYKLIGTPFGGSSVTSAPVTLNVQAASAPVLLTDTTLSPSAPTIAGNATFSASFVGNLPISYQWQISANASGIPASNIAGATNATLTLTNLQLANSGYYYSLRATNAISPYTANSSWVQLTVQPLTALVQLIATNYDGSSVWTDSSGNGNNATYSGSTAPTLAAFVTPNGGSAVSITNGSGSFVLASPLDPSSGYTVFAYVQPTTVTNAGSRYALTGGTSATGNAALEYDFYQGHQNYLQEYVGGGGSGTATIPTNSFSLIDLAVNASGSSFRFNGASDGTQAGSTFLNPLTRIANNQGSGDGFVGQIAEIDIYNGVLTYVQITNIEAQLTAKYVVVNSIVIGAAAVAPTNNVYAGNPVTLSAPIIGATGTATFHWQTDNGSGGASFANISGATTTNYVLNTTGLNGTYEYQLVGTPFGGGSVTSAPVTLTVQAATAPLLVTDTTPNPANATVAGNLTFSAAFTGTLPISYQWQISANASGIPASNIAGATNATLTLTNLQLANSGYYYSLRATNAISPYTANSSWVQLTVQPLSALVQLLANNYDPVGGVWTDSSGNGNNATYSGSLNPSLVSTVTPNGSSAVNISAGDGSFVLASSLDPSSGYTVFAYVMPANSTSTRGAIVGGEGYGALEYDFYNGYQDYLNEGYTDVGHGIATISTTRFSSVNLAVNSSGAAFRLNGASDGSVAGQTFTAPITRIGNNGGFGSGTGGDGLLGQVAEIDIYSGVLSYAQITNIEARLTASYGAASSIATNPTNITATVSGNILNLSWPADHIGWRLLVQTNNLAAGISSNTNDWTTVIGSTAVNQTNITIIPTKPTEFYRLVYP